MTHRTRTLIVIALVAVLAATALAQPGRAPRARAGGPGHCDMGPGWRLERMAEVLDLTEAQQTAIAELQEKARDQAVELRKDLARLRNQKHGEMLKDTPSEKTLVELTEKMGEIRTKLQVQRMQTRLAVREQLTAEQRDQMLLMGPRHGGRGGRGGPGCDGGPCDGSGRENRRGGRGQGRGPGRSL